MKKATALLLGLTLCIGLLAGCGEKPAEPTPGAPSAPVTQPTNQPPAALSGTVNTDGSTSMEKVVGILGESFMNANADVKVNYSGTGSGSGVAAALAGTADIGLSSRQLKEDEITNGAVAHVVALDGVAVVVNPGNTVTDLSVEDIAKLATGEITNWSQLGGADAPVALIGREAGSGTRTAFEEIVGVTDQCKFTNELTSTGDVVATVASNPNAFGYVSLSSVNDTVKAVSVGGVACTEATVKDGTYAIQRPFLLVTKEGAQLSTAAQTFLDYALSADVADLIAAAGAVAP